MTFEELKPILAIDENYRIERTVSTGNMDKFQEAICAFANDLPGKRLKGYLLIGVDDNGNPSGLKVDDALMIKISNIRSDGNILPLPVMSTEKVETPQGDVLVVEVTPSFATPVRYRGRTFVRIGPRRDIANAEEERILSERCAAAMPTFDTSPCRSATLADIDTDVIVREYLPRAIDAEVLAIDTRQLKEQLASLHLYNMQWDCPTYAALIMFGHRPQFFMPGAYIQYVKFDGTDNGAAIVNERRFEGNLYTLLPRLENFVNDGIVNRRPVSVSTLREKDVQNYPSKALRELLMNAVMHRDYQSNTPTRIYQYNDRIEIMNSGGLYGNARPENFPYVNDYRNNTLAGMLKTFNYVNMFNHGVQEVKELLRSNGNPDPDFQVNLLTVFLVKVMDGNVLEADQVRSQLFEQIDKGILQPILPPILQPTDQPILQPTQVYDPEVLFTDVNDKLKRLVISVDVHVLSSQDILERYASPTLGGHLTTDLTTHLTTDLTTRLTTNPTTNPTTPSQQSFSKTVLRPALEQGLICMTLPDKPTSKKQQYHLTEKGLLLLKWLNQHSENSAAQEITE